MMEKEFFELLKEFFNTTEMHQEISFNNETCVIDKTGNTITITLKENKDKKEFESWVEKIPNDIFMEVMETIGPERTKEYDTANYKNIMNEFKNTAANVLRNKINTYQQLLKTV